MVTWMSIRCYHRPTHETCVLFFVLQTLSSLVTLTLAVLEAWVVLTALRTTAQPAWEIMADPMSIVQTPLRAGVLTLYLVMLPVR